VRVHDGGAANTAEDKAELETDVGARPGKTTRFSFEVKI
jgi:hypothetical protein